MHRLHRVHAGAGRTGHHDVGGTPLDRDHRLAHGEVAARLAERERVARAAEIVVDRDVAGRHVGQVFEQPQRCQLGHAIARPELKVEAAIGTAAPGDAGGEILRQCEHVVGAEDAAEPLRGMVRHGGAAVMEGPLRGRHRHLAFAAHHLAAFADRLFSLAVEGAEVVDLAGKAPGLGRVVERDSARGKGVERADAAAALDQACPEVVEPEPQGADNAHAGDHHPSLSRPAHAHVLFVAGPMRAMAISFWSRSAAEPGLDDDHHVAPLDV